MYFGGTIMTFALPYGAFIVCTVTLFYLFKAKHSSPKLRYLASAFTTSVTTKEPGPAPAPPVPSMVEEAGAAAGEEAAAAEAAQADEAAAESPAESAAEQESE
jgi:hypothetical protein